MMEVKDNGEIIDDGSVVGHIDWSENTLVDIFIDEEYRGEGIGTEVVSQFVEHAKRDGYNIVKTTTVISSSMETVLRKNGFKNGAIPLDRVSDDILEMANHENEIRWYKEI